MKSQRAESCKKPKPEPKHRARKMRASELEKREIIEAIESSMLNRIQRKNAGNQGLNFKILKCGRGSGFMKSEPQEGQDEITRREKSRRS